MKVHIRGAKRTEADEVELADHGAVIGGNLGVNVVVQNRVLFERPVGHLRTDRGNVALPEHGKKCNGEPNVNLNFGEKSIFKSDRVVGVGDTREEIEKIAESHNART